MLDGVFDQVHRLARISHANRAMTFTYSDRVNLTPSLEIEDVDSNNAGVEGEVIYNSEEDNREARE